MRGLSKKANSNRKLSRKLKLLNRISFSKYHHGHIMNISGLRKLPYALHSLVPTPDNYIYRACINESNVPFNSIERIKLNPSPSYFARANIKGQGIGYYACAPDIAIIEACQDSLRRSLKRKFSLTVSKWKIINGLSVQIMSNNAKALEVGNDLSLYNESVLGKKRKTLIRKEYRTYLLKSRFLSDQYAKTKINSGEKDYVVSAYHSNTLLKHDKIDAIVYPSIGYLYRGFNYAICPDSFKKGSFKLTEASLVDVSFDKKVFNTYPEIKRLQITSKFDNDEIIWGNASTQHGV